MVNLDFPIRCTPQGLTKNEGAAGAPAQPGNLSMAKGQCAALAPSCSPSLGNLEQLRNAAFRCALRALDRSWSAEA
jgi:hypothetical protein